MAPKNGFVPTEGLSVHGEIGWHSHGSGDLKDTDIDLAIIISATATIDPTYTTMVLWGLPMNDQGLISDLKQYEVGYFAYKRGLEAEPATWDLR